MTGAGDIAPSVAGPGGNTVEQSLLGVFAGLIVVIVHRHDVHHRRVSTGLIRTTLAASPRRGRVLAAKAIVLGAVTFVVGLAASAFAFWFVARMRRDSGDDRPPGFVGSPNCAWSSVPRRCSPSPPCWRWHSAAILRRSAGAVAIAVVLIVLPYILAIASVSARRHPRSGCCG